MKSPKVCVFYILIFIYGLFFYFANLSSFVFGGDSSELVTNLVSFGISHPPGYPLYTLLGNIIVRVLPLNNIYIKLSLISFVFMILASQLIFLIIYSLKKNAFTALISSLFFLSLFPVWLYGIVPEVFALAVFLIVTQLYILFKLDSLKTFSSVSIILKSIFYLSLGLSVSHHHFFILFIPAYIYLILQNYSLKNFMLKDKVKNFLWFLLGCLFYFYCPIASFYNATSDYENAKTLTGFFRLITRSSYGVFKAYATSGGDFINRIFDFFSVFIFLLHDFKPLGLLFIIFGFIYLYKKYLKLFYFFGLNLLIILFFFFYSNFFLTISFGVATYERFLIFLYVILIFYFGFGVNYVLEITFSFINKYTEKKIIKYLSRFIIFSLIIFLFVFNITSNYPVISSVKKINDFETLGKDLLNTAPNNAILIMTTDNSVFLTQHLQEVKKIRRDITLFTSLAFERDYIRDKLKKQNPQIYFSNLDSSKVWKDFINSNYRRKIYIFSDRPFSDDLWVPYGLLWKYYPDITDFENEKEEVIKKNEFFWSQYKIPELNTSEKNILFLEDIKSLYTRQAWAYINFLVSINKPSNSIRIAKKYYKNLKNDKKFLISYINLKVFFRECDNNLKIDVDNMINKSIDSSTDYLPLINFYKICADKDKKKIEELNKKYLDFKKNEETPLEKL